MGPHYLDFSDKEALERFQKTQPVYGKAFWITAAILWLAVIAIALPSWAGQHKRNNMPPQQINSAPVYATKLVTVKNGDGEWGILHRGGWSEGQLHPKTRARLWSIVEQDPRNHRLMDPIRELRKGDRLYVPIPK